MNMIKQKAFRVFYFYLVTAGLPVMFMNLALENAKMAPVMYAIMIALAFPLSLLPGRVGKGFPLRITITAAVALSVVIGMFFVSQKIGMFFIRGMLSGIIAGVLMLFCVREACLDVPVWTGMHGPSVGLILYIIPGFVYTYADEPFLKNLMWIETLVFLGVTAFYMNTDNMRTGLSARSSTSRPPRSLVTGNRILTGIFAGIALLVIFWGNLREAATAFGKWCIWWAMKIVYHILSLLDSSRGSEGGQQQQADPSQMFAGFEETEPSSFWVFMEKVLVVVAIIVGILLVLLALRTLFRLIVKMVRFLREYMAKFAQNASEDYVDEQEDLFDLDDIREQTKERLRNAVKRFTQRPKKWEEMDTRERVRFCVRSLYGKSGYYNGELRSLTIREAVSKLPKTDLGEEQLSALYEKARYSEESPTEQEAASLRKAVRP